MEFLRNMRAATTLARMLVTQIVKTKMAVIPGRIDAKILKDIGTPCDWIESPLSIVALHHSKSDAQSTPSKTHCSHISIKLLTIIQDAIIQ